MPTFLAPFLFATSLVLLGLGPWGGREQLLVTRKVPLK